MLPSPSMQPSWKPDVLYNREYLTFVAFNYALCFLRGIWRIFNCWRTSFPRYHGSIPQCMRLRFAPRLGIRIIHGGKWEMENEEMKRHTARVLRAIFEYASISCHLLYMWYAYVIGDYNKVWNAFRFHCYRAGGLDIVCCAWLWAL